MDTNKMRSELRVSAESAIANNPPGGDGNPFPALAVRAVDVLALLAEIERLERRNSNQQESIRQYQDHMEGGESILSLTNERDRLKAESEALRKALGDLLSLYEDDEGCHSLPEYIAGRTAIAKEASHG